MARHGQYDDSYRVVCGQKVAYATRPEASRKAAELKRLKRWKMKPYRCPVCNQWHLTREL